MRRILLNHKTDLYGVKIYLFKEVLHVKFLIIVILRLLNSYSKLKFHMSPKVSHVQTVTMGSVQYTRSVT